MIAIWSVEPCSKAIKVHGIPVVFNESWSQATAWNLWVFLITKQCLPQHPPPAFMQNNMRLCCCKPTFCSWRMTVHNLLFSFWKGKKAKHVYNSRSKFSVLLLWWAVLSLLKLIWEELLCLLGITSDTEGHFNVVFFCPFWGCMIGMLCHRAIQLEKCWFVP